MSAAAQRAATAPAKKEAILDRLKALHPNGLWTAKLLDEFGWCARTRIVELRGEGWDIPETFSDDNKQAYYCLASLVQGPPAPQIVEAAKIIIRSDKTVEVVPYADGEWSSDLADAIEGEAVDRLLARFDVDPQSVDFVRTPGKKRGMVISLAERQDPQQDWFAYCVE